MTAPYRVARLDRGMATWKIRSGTLKAKALAFLDAPWAAKAPSVGWDAGQLFGLYPPAPRPVRRARAGDASRVDRSPV